MAIVYKTQLVRRIATRTGLSQDRVTDVLNATILEVSEGLKRGDKVQVTNFGTFYSRPRAAGTAPDFKTGRLITVAPRTIPAFRAGALLKEAVSQMRRPRRGRPKLERFLSRLRK